VSAGIARAASRMAKLIEHDNEEQNMASKTTAKKTSSKATAKKPPATAKKPPAVSVPVEVAVPVPVPVEVRLPAPHRRAWTAKKPPARPSASKALRGWKWAAAAAAQEAADQGVVQLDELGFEAALARSYLKRVQGSFTHPKKPTWRNIAQALWDDLGVETAGKWTDGGRYELSPYHLQIVQDESHRLYDARGHEKTDPNPKEFAVLVEGIEAVGGVMQAVYFTEERGAALLVDGRRRSRGARAVNLRRLSAASNDEPPVLIETLSCICVRDPVRVMQIKNGSNYHRCPEDALRQLAGIQQLERQMPLVAIAAMMGVTTQTLANIRSLDGLCQRARDELGTKITLSLAYRLARELPKRQEEALQATERLPPKARQRAVEAFLAGDSPEAEARSMGVRDVKSLAKRLSANPDPDPELKPLRLLFAMLRGDSAAERLLPAKWRECLGLDVSDSSGQCQDPAPPPAGEAVPARRQQLVIDDGVPEGMRVQCLQCGAEPSEYCLGDGPDEEEQWGTQDGTRIHQTRIIRAQRDRMPSLPALLPAHHEGRKGKRGAGLSDGARDAG